MFTVLADASTSLTVYGTVLIILGVAAFIFGTAELYLARWKHFFVIVVLITGGSAAAMLGAVILHSRNYG